MLPILYQSPDLILYSYPFLIGIGWGVAYQIYFSLQDKNSSRLKAQFIFWGIFFAAYLGAKLFFILTSSQSGQMLQQLSFWTGGGFVFYGGFIGGVVYLSVFKFYDKSLGVNDLWPVVPSLVFGHALGRVGCFLAGCCYGRPTEQFWGIFLHGTHRHPTQLFEASALFILGIYLLKASAPKIRLLVYYFWIYGAVRFSIESLRGDSIRGQWGVFTPSQWISLGLIGLGFAVLLLSKNRHLRQ